ncbi:hypothetical protein FISHEDRAFT_72170 [Fistulina hepatica ATCC 64428]|uniref:Uncharacterized protein n=1 Tax=Fistulina hepatica ATCC 64428 TaxID=1128425 RepID=A0A0D7AHY9_9AGAR|nr:hypothetical protein FISHEDRAFT_72170 [Fistulina hepatica ATCC 64428]
MPHSASFSPIPLTVWFLMNSVTITHGAAIAGSTYIARGGLASSATSAEEKASLGLVLGPLLGGLSLLVVVGILLFCYIRRRRQMSTRDIEVTPYPTSHSAETHKPLLFGSDSSCTDSTGNISRCTTTPLVSAGHYGRVQVAHFDLPSPPRRTPHRPRRHRDARRGTFVDLHNQLENLRMQIASLRTAEHRPSPPRPLSLAADATASELVLPTPPLYQAPGRTQSFA